MARDLLADLLRRCHRAELERLGARVGTAGRGLGHASLAKAVATDLRRVGGNTWANLLWRQGSGPPWPEVVAACLERQGNRPSGDVRADEIAVLRHAVARRLDGMDPAERGSALAALGLAEPPPTTGTDPGWPAIAPGAAMRLVPFVMLSPVGPVAFLLWLGAEPRDQVLVPAIVEVARLRDAVSHRLTIGVVGSPSTGKDAALRALFGFDGLNVSPVAGSTRSVEIRRLPEAPALYVVNTPGMGDVLEAVTEEARQILDHIDVYLYLVNAQGGAQQRERNDFHLVRRSGRPLAVVVNKIDTLRPEDRDRFLERTRAQLGAKDTPMFLAAFDPLPQLMPAPVGVDAVRGWLAGVVRALGKEAAALGPTPQAGGGIPPGSTKT